MVNSVEEISFARRARDDGFRVTGSRSRGARATASARATRAIATASIDGAGNVSIQSLDVDGSSVAGSVRGGGGGKNDVIIDV